MTFRFLRYSHEVRKPERGLISSVYDEGHIFRRVQIVVLLVRLVSLPFIRDEIDMSVSVSQYLGESCYRNSSLTQRRLVRFDSRAKSEPRYATYFDVGK